MKNKITYLFILFLNLNLIIAQQREFNLSKGNCQMFNGNIYCYGISIQKQNSVFHLYKFDLKLNITDSVQVDLGKTLPENYLQIYSDTLHNYLNIYLQKKEKKELSVLRFNKKFELIANIDKVDIARLNNTILFSSEVLYCDTNVYSLKVETDTSGKQFYLNKYSLKSEAQNFDYEFKWQFPFERKNIHSAHIFFANKTYVLLYVTVNGGTRHGQWILKIHAETGKLLKASKLNDKGENNSYEFGDFFMDPLYRSIHLVGQKFTEAQFNVKESKLSISNAVSSSIYYLEIDSLGELVNKQDFKIAINDIKTGVKKTTSSYLLRFKKLVKKAEGTVSFESDIFKSSNSSLCFQYCNSIEVNLTPGEDKLIMEKNIISPNLLVEQYYTTTDKLDMNGKLCIDSLNQFEKIFYKAITFPVKLQFKFDPEKNPMWILTKHTNKKNTVNFSFLKPVKKIYQTTNIEEINESNNPVFTNLSSDSFLISTQTDEGKYRLKLYNW